MVFKGLGVVISIFLLGFCLSAAARPSSGEERGPILFPRNVNDEQEGESANNVITIPKSDRVGATSYEKFKRKNTSVGDIAKNKNLNKEVLQALARHGSKVLRVPLEPLGKDHVPVSRKSAKKNYAFSYKVVDSATGDDFSHSQVRTGKATNGEYRVRLPDGRVQIVKYTADKNGYKADVRYEEDEISGNVHHDPIRHPNSIPATSQLKLLSPDYTQHKVYYEDIGRTDTSSSTTKGQQDVSPTEKVPIYNHADLEGLGAYRGRHNEQVPHPSNVRVYTSNAREYSMGYFSIASTAPSLLYNEFELYPNLAIAPNIITNADSGIVVPEAEQKKNLMDTTQFVAPSSTPTPTTLFVLDQHGKIVDTYHLIAPPTTA